MPADADPGMAVHANCAYIIPPNYDMAFLNGALHLIESTAPRGHRLAIDFFFRSLAQDQHERAIGILLSGTGSDGTPGLREIKGEGGSIGPEPGLLRIRRHAAQALGKLPRGITRPTPKNESATAHARRQTVSPRSAAYAESRFYYYMAKHCGMFVRRHSHDKSSLRPSPD